MALNYPLSLAQFFEPLPVASVTFRPDDNRTFTETGGGELIPAARGARLWKGQVSIDIDSHANMAAFEAKIALLEEAGASLLIYDRRKPYPTSDPLGTQIGAANPQIAAINANNRELDISGLPSGFVVSSGDLIGWIYGSNPTRYALHRVVTGAVASGSYASSIEVTPRLRTGTPQYASVSFVRPVCKAVLDQADYGAGRSVITQGGSFAWKQTLR